MLGEDLAPGGLGRAAPVDVGGVEEVDAGVERRLGAGARLLELDPAGVGEPRAERDLRDFEVRAAEFAISHCDSSCDRFCRYEAHCPLGQRGDRQTRVRAHIRGHRGAVADEQVLVAEDAVPGVDHAVLGSRADHGAAEDVRGQRDAEHRLGDARIGGPADPLGEPPGRVVGGGDAVGVGVAADPARW